MDTENIELAKQLLDKLEKSLKKLKELREQNLPTEFTQLKKECFELQTQLDSIFK